MGEAVMAVFSGTDVDDGVFRRAVEIAEAEGARLVLLNVRHLHRAERLEEALASDTYLGRGAIRDLKRSVKEQRNHAVRRALAALAVEARERGLEVEVLEIRGPYEDSVREAATEQGVRTVVAHRTPDLGGQVRVISVGRS